MPPIPESLDFSWEMLIFLGAICVIAFILSWRLFSMRNADHVKIAENLATEVEKLENTIGELKESLEEKIEGKISGVKKEAVRSDKQEEERYKELHGRTNKGVDDLGKVKGEVKYQEGVTDTILKFMLAKRD